jgi:hypothetical protein
MKLKNNNMKYIIIIFSLAICTSLFGQIEQNVNKTSGTSTNQINSIDSIRFNTTTLEMEIILNNGSVESHAIRDINNVTFAGQLVGEIASLDCNGSNINGSLISEIAANGVSAEIDYTGGNGGVHSGQSVSSTHNLFSLHYVIKQKHKIP